MFYFTPLYGLYRDRPRRRGERSEKGDHRGPGRKKTRYRPTKKGQRKGEQMRLTCREAEKVIQCNEREMRQIESLYKNMPKEPSGDMSR